MVDAIFFRKMVTLHTKEKVATGRYFSSSCLDYAFSFRTGKVRLVALVTFSLAWRVSLRDAIYEGKLVFFTILIRKLAVSSQFLAVNGLFS